MGSTISSKFKIVNEAVYHAIHSFYKKFSPLLKKNESIFIFTDSTGKILFLKSYQYDNASIRLGEKINFLPKDFLFKNHKKVVQLTMF